MKISGIGVFIAWLITMVLGYVGLGTYFYEMFEGMDPSMLSVGPVVVFAVFALASMVVTVIWARNLGSDRPAAEVPSGRRRFLVGGAALTGGVIGVGAATAGRMSGWFRTTLPMMGETSEADSTSDSPHPSWKGSRIVSRKPLGSTGFMVSDISIGTGRLMGHSDPEALFREALDRGVNYIDTSPDYAGAKSETAIGNVLKDRNREELFVV
ncbi:MAG: hypothetical protein HN816_10225, partial [Gammaproteobacteria bacterium]|nr:hypothetical protein [Gammaproteobacteria bacterium]